LENYRILAAAREQELDNIKKLNEMERARIEEEARRRDIDYKNQLQMMKLERQKNEQAAELAKKEAALAKEEADKKAQQIENERLKSEQREQEQKLLQQQSDAKIMKLGLALALFAVLGRLPSSSW